MPMDMRYIGWAGYGLAECTVECLTVSVCEPELDTDEHGVLHAVGEEIDITPIISARDYYVPNLKTST